MAFRWALVVGILALACASARVAALPSEIAPPGLSPIEATFANTVRIAAKDGVTLVYFNRDGTFISRGPKGDEFGTWKIEGDKICTHTKLGGNSCGLLQRDRQVGDRWVHVIAGQTFEVEIIAGR